MTDLISYTSFQQDRLDLFWRFVSERQAIWYRRYVQHLPAPWTMDPILQHERFTNVYRELDPGTQYAIRHILETPAPTPDKIFNIMLYRLIGRAETHAALGFQHLETFNPEHMAGVLRRLRDVEHKAPFTAAYMVSAYSGLGTSDKIESVALIFATLQAGFPRLYGRITACRSAAEVYAKLCAIYGFGNFLAYQVLVDLLYPLTAQGGTPLLPYSHDDWASAGPGARRGLCLLLRDGIRAPDLEVMQWLRSHQQAEFARTGEQFRFLRDSRGQLVELSLANIQNCLCEFHKYVKIRDGTGRGRRKFRAPSPIRPVPLPFRPALMAAAPP